MSVKHLSRARSWWVWAAALLVLYPLGNGPMTYVVVRLNGGTAEHLAWPHRAIFAATYGPFYRALDHAPKPVFNFWERYDTFFYRLAVRP
jgi:hypothetical protein